MSCTVEKVTVFVTRSVNVAWQARRDSELLLIEHPTAGIQLPAGTVEVGEPAEAAALREANEETGLSSLTIRSELGYDEQALPPEQRMVGSRTPVYAHPDKSSFDWAYLPRGITVTIRRREGPFYQVTYETFDRVPDSNYVSMTITGWVPREVLCRYVRRHFFHLEYKGDSEDSWTLFSDHHYFRLFWAPIRSLPALIPPQDDWLQFMPQTF